MIPSLPTTSERDIEQSVRDSLGALADQARKGCGLVYELYVERFSSAVDVAYGSAEPAIRTLAFELATREFDYSSNEQRMAARREANDEGLCSHFLDKNTCPCGCFEG